MWWQLKTQPHEDIFCLRFTCAWVILCESYKMFCYENENEKRKYKKKICIYTIYTYMVVWFCWLLFTLCLSFSFMLSRLVTAIVISLVIDHSSGWAPTPLASLDCEQIAPTFIQENMPASNEKQSTSVDLCGTTYPSVNPLSSAFLSTIILGQDLRFWCHSHRQLFISWRNSDITVP